MEFTLRGSFIELDNLLKTVGWAPHGAAAKMMVREGAVRVNGQPEARVRRKLRTGDRVSLCPVAGKSGETSPPAASGAGGWVQDREIVLV